MIIYGSTMSPFVRKTVAFLNEKGVEFELKGIVFQDPDPGFRAASPLGKMPAMHDDGYDLADSTAICHYVDAAYDGPRLIPEDPRLRGKTVWWDKYSDTILSACGTKMFFNRIVAPLFLQREGNEEVAAAAQRDELPKILDFLESHVPEPGGFLVGDSLTLADISIASPFANLGHLGVEMDSERHARINAWVASMHERPSFARAIAGEKRLLKSLEDA